MLQTQFHHDFLPSSGSCGSRRSRTISTRHWEPLPTVHWVLCLWFSVLPPFIVGLFIPVYIISLLYGEVLHNHNHSGERILQTPVSYLKDSNSSILGDFGLVVLTGKVLPFFNSFLLQKKYTGGLNTRPFALAVCLPQFFLCSPRYFQGEFFPSCLCGWLLIPSNLIRYTLIHCLPHLFCGTSIARLTMCAFRPHPTHYQYLAEPSPSAPTGPLLRRTRVVFGTKSRSPAVMISTTEFDPQKLVTDADYRAAGWDVYRARHRDDCDRVQREIDAKNPERAQWRRTLCTTETLEDMFDLDAMFDVGDDDGSEVEEEAAEEEEEEKMPDLVSLDALSGEEREIAGHPHWSNSIEFHQRWGRCNGEDHKRAWSNIIDYEVGTIPEDEGTLGSDVEPSLTDDFMRYHDESVYHLRHPPGIWAAPVPSQSLDPIDHDVVPHMTSNGVDRLRAWFNRGST